jgi:hypothetical protein
MLRTAHNLDRRSLDLHKLIAQRLQVNPALLDQTKATLARWRAMDSRGCAGWDEWSAALDLGLEATLEAMLDPGERGQYLRSCTPFTRVLAARERAEFLKSWNASS